MTETEDYILGADRAELERLGYQHKVWVEQGYALWTRAGFRAGNRLLDLGCGPGFTTFELAALVGKDGQVFARDMSQGFIEFLGTEAKRRALPQVEASLGPIEDLDVPAESFDGAYARWLFCWLPDAEVALRRVADAVRPGGRIALQEYLDWGAMKMMPRSAAFDRAVLGCMESWRVGGATIDIGEHMPELAAACGLELEHYRPVARIGRVGSLEWRWITTFFSTYVPKITADGLLTQEECDACLEEFARRNRDDLGFAYTPTMTDIILRKPER